MDFQLTTILYLINFLDQLVTDNVERNHPIFSLILANRLAICHKQQFCLSWAFTRQPYLVAMDRYLHWCCLALLMLSITQEMMVMS